ncbi:hypothetical protein ACQSSU_20450 [Micromonospora echinospora]
MYQRLFALRRDADPTGMSGTGTIAYGATLPDGRAIVQWLGDRPSTVVWRNTDDAEYIHSHGGRAPTRVEWLNPTTDEADTARQAIDAGMRLLGDVAGATAITRMLRTAADGRRDLAAALRSEHPGIADSLTLQEFTLRSAASVAEGDLGPLYDWLPSHQWTPDMLTRLYGEQHQPG